MNITDKITITNECNMELMKRYPDNYFDLAIVDPPYGINQDKTQNDLGGKKGFVKGAGTYKKYHSTNWDSEVPNEEYFKEIDTGLKATRLEGGVIIADYDGDGDLDLALSGLLPPSILA